MYAQCILSSFLFYIFFHFCSHLEITIKHLRFVSGCCSSMELIMWSQQCWPEAVCARPETSYWMSAKPKRWLWICGGSSRRSTHPRGSTGQGDQESTSLRGWPDTQTSWLYHLRQLSEGPKHCPFWCCGKANVLGTGKLRTVAWCTAKRPSALHSRLCWTTPELVGLWRILTTTAADYSSFYPQAKASFLSSSGWWTLTSDLCICSALLSCVNLLHCTAHLHFAYKNVHSLIVKFVLHLWHLYNLLFYILKNCTAFLQTGPTYFYSLFIYISFCNADVYSDSIPLYCTLVFLAQPQAYATLHFTTHIAWSMWQIHPLDLECM